VGKTKKLLNKKQNRVYSLKRKVNREMIRTLSLKLSMELL